MLRHSLFKYYDQRIWAEKFLDGEMLFRSLAYFRDCEDAVRGDEHEGTSRFLPDGGLQITNQTQGTQFTLAEYAFESTVKANEIFVFCASRRFGDDLAKEFNAVVAVEITRMPTFCERIRAALPPTATFRARALTITLSRKVEIHVGRYPMILRPQNWKSGRVRKKLGSYFR